MSDVRENALGKAGSAYLRSAQHQAVAWQEWGAEAFAQAAAEDKPVLLDIGAVWCHWCRVMDRESYENAETARMINDLFVAVKVDRDERPDVDARYQAAVAAISGQGGWPLTAFLTPEGKPYFGGGYFPPDDRYGRPGFQRVLLTMVEAFQKQRSDVEESANGVVAMLEEGAALATQAGVAGPELLGKLVGAVAEQFDERNGGFGSQPKFPHSGAIGLLLDVAGSPPMNDETVHEWGTRSAAVARVSLAKMAAGGMHDQLAGGFHRYSVDEAWRVPHFEKMAYDNSELLKNYVRAYLMFGDAEFARVARGIVGWMDAVLSDRERGGFYASQVADAAVEDDGSYFTWTRAEVREVLTAEEFEVTARYFELRDVGDMKGNPKKNVLHVGATVEGIAKAVGKSVEDVRGLVKGASAKMLAVRMGRPTPLVDRTVYTGWNGMCVSAYLQAGRGLGMPEVTAFALKTLDRVLNEAWEPGVGLGHVVAYGDGVAALARVAGGLDDYAFVVIAALDAWEATGEIRYSAAAKEIGDAMVARFYDAVGGGFFDIEPPEDAIGLMSLGRKPIQDSPTPAGNAVAAMGLLRLAELTGDGAYAAKARATLEAFAGVVEHYGLYAANYSQALLDFGA